ncbi:hypothetical protein ABW20_dc0106731 [Dactylellina cionopaga]|nr:hypothetical protein ABW20_dc0106731 [Dactylellina cionopaga]
MAPHCTSPPAQPDRRQLSEDDDLAQASGARSDRHGVEPIAIVGLACRLPGGTSSSTEFWDLLVDGRSGQCEFPSSRLNVDGFYKPGAGLSGSINMRGGFFLQEDIRNFENNFFGINNAEAAYMDPQQRKLLEVVFECLESAGIPLETLSESNTGCYVGSFTTDYQTMQSRDVDGLHRYSMAGMGSTILSNRISHAFNLNGPSMTLDTACSSSMYCLHLACQALESGDCDGAIVASANLIQSVEQLMTIMRGGVLSKSSMCHTFDASADGYARADGVGALYLKRLSDALRDGDPIRSVIRGTAVNTNGRTQGIALPSAKHQESAIRKAYSRAGLSCNDTTYVECHGTGTSVGDPIEVDAVSRVFGGFNQRLLRIGSVKTNLGHSEAASAISSLIKVTLALENNFIPPTIGITEINPKIKPIEMGIEIVREGQVWLDTGSLSPLTCLRAGVNSFGYGGANGHAILENASVHTPQNYDSASQLVSSSRTTYILPFSASTDEALEARVNNLADYNMKAASLQDLTFTLTCRRTTLEKRGYILVSDKTFSKQISGQNLQLSNKPTTRALSQCAFIFTGQGAQWPRMCMELFGEFSVFRNTFTEIDSILQKLPHPPNWNLKSLIFEPKETSRMMDPESSQPVCTAIQIALVLLLDSWGIVPAAVIGHSSGEIAAAFAAGLISLAEAISIAYYRGYVVGSNTNDGAMMAAGISEDEVNFRIKALNLKENIGAACINSPNSTTVSGDALAIDTMLKNLQDEGLFARKLQTQGQAYHSHHMQDVGAKYQELLQITKSMGPSIKMRPGATWVSSVTAEVIKTGPVDISYWRKNLESPVEFYKAVSRLTELGKYHLIELGPHSALELPIKQIRDSLGVSEENLPYSAAIIRFKNPIETVLGLAGQLFLHGYKISLDKVNEMSPGVSNYKVLHDLPKYSWTYPETPLWHEPRASAEFRFRKYPRHELLGTQIPGGNGLEYTWKNIVRLEESPWLKGHKLGDTIVFPGAGYISMVIEAIRQAERTARIAKNHRATTVDLEDLEGGPKSSSTTVWYDSMSHKGLDFGPEWRTVTDFALKRIGTHQYCRASMPLKRKIDSEMYPVHPVTIDAIFQTCLVANSAGNTKDLTVIVPTRIGFGVFPLEVDANIQRCQANASSIPNGFGRALGNAELIDPEGWARIRMENIHLTQCESGVLENVAGQGHQLMRVLWKPDTSPGLLTDKSLATYLETTTATKFEGDAYEKSLEDVIACVRLIAHKNPYLKILDLGSIMEGFSKAVLKALSATSPFPQLLSYLSGEIDENGLSGSKVDLGSGDLGPWQTIPSELQFDLITIPDHKLSSRYFGQMAKELKSRLAPWGRILAVSSPPDTLLLSEAGLAVTQDPKKNICLLHRVDDDQIDVDIKASPIAIIERISTTFGDILMEEVGRIIGQQPFRITFDKISLESIPSGSTIISLLELEEALLGHTSDLELERIKVLTTQASSLVWVTGGNLLEGQTPDHSLAFGLSRAVMAEQPALRFFVYDVDDAKLDWKRTTKNIVSIFKKIPPERPDFEYLERNGIVHVSRFIPDNTLNEIFRQRQGTENVQIPLAELGNAQLSIKSPGNFDSIHFRRISLPGLAADEVQVSVRAAGLNAKDLYALAGKVETKGATCLLEFSGIVEKIGAAVTSVAVGDRVYVMAPSKFRTSEIVPHWACHKLRDSEDYEVMSTLPVVYVTALYALHHKACLQKGESILIHSGAGGVGMAAIQIAQLVGAEIFTTVSTKEKKEFLVKNFNIKPGNIFSSRDASFESCVMRATNGKGVDVVLNSLTGDLLHASWACCGSFGRFVEIGKKDLIDSGRLGMEQFLKNATYTAFDLSDLYYSHNPSHRRIWIELAAKALELYREGKVTAFPLEVFDIKDLPSGLRRFASRNRIGKIAISLGDPTSILNVQLSRYSTSFSNKKEYLMIGCLGGLGRSLAKWMVERGARKFVFLGRSGLDKEPARLLIKDLRTLGAQCKVVRGDICLTKDVERMVEEADGPIGGVVQAAMGLSHALFNSMSNKSWRAGIDQKVQGTWNIHNAIKGKDDELDFFLMTSSVSGSVGAPAESNYCAANYFLDNFARYRRSLGLPGTAVGLGMISEVGYVHENPDIEALLLRKGLQRINEGEMLSIIDICLSQPMSIPWAYDHGASAHFLTGLDPFGTTANCLQNVKGDNPLFQGSRASLLARAVHDKEESTSNQSRDLPSEIFKARESGAPILETVTTYIAKRFCDLVLMPADNFNVTKPLDQFGMDSMIAAEFRSWFFQVLKLDIPFLEFLSKTTTIESLSKIALHKLESQT